ncbi:Vitamin B12 import ATP-binding protein BtuD [Campylobacter majalis]|uniref:Vitamin B12 import ATP-binding protein BtuD n=1 Tax=Campylobacter majalis TaxID=2790656 RepID=A0ABM8Q8F6_9BACT|nr:ABC transporter ATP-binding protein [Campylobacter majalis]CAD7289073.1 Vitamin B12 import ATP-binding protein BtuD [Campylobacter majalis]
MIKIDIKKRLNGANGEFVLNANLQINRGEFVCLYGKSGSGKTTILRLLAGFETPDSGEIVVNGVKFYSGSKSLPPQKRNIGYLFQDYALFDNMSVYKNLLYAKNDTKKADELLYKMDLALLKNAKIQKLSGGQKQRVALARALMRDPEILLLDEPLSALDIKTRENLQEYLAKIHAQHNISIILVSHDVAEIYRLCERVYVVDDGKIQSALSPKELFLKQLGSQKLAFNAKILELNESDSVSVAIVLVANQLCKVVLSQTEADGLRVGDDVMLSAKAFAMSLKKLSKF